MTPGRPDLAVATVLAGGLPSRTRIYVDLSRPFATNRIVVDFDACTRIPGIGELVTAYDSAEQQEATAEVVGLNWEQRTVSLAVDWTTVRQVEA